MTISEPTKRISESTKTNDQGDFVFPALQPGNYIVSVEAMGFKKLTRPAIALDVNDKLQALETCGTQTKAMVLMPDTSKRFRQRMFLHMTLSSSRTM